ncbi:MAG: cupin domain-containing protein [Marinibacterium sp.]
MKKTDATWPELALDALLDGTELTRSLPGTRPDLAGDAEALDARLTPILEALPAADPPADLFDAIEAEIDGQPDAPMQTQRAHEGIWQPVADKIWQKTLSEDPESGRTMFLLRCLPGAIIAPHVHEKTEQLYILEGELWVDGKVYSAGDAQHALAGTHHAEITMPGGCLVLVCA